MSFQSGRIAGPVMLIAAFLSTVHPNIKLDTELLFFWAKWHTSTPTHLWVQKLKQTFCGVENVTHKPTFYIAQDTIMGQGSQAKVEFKLTVNVR